MGSSFEANSLVDDGISIETRLCDSVGTHAAVSILRAPPPRSRRKKHAAFAMVQSSECGWWMMGQKIRNKRPADASVLIFLEISPMHPRSVRDDVVRMWTRITTGSHEQCLSLSPPNPSTTSQNHEKKTTKRKWPLCIAFPIFEFVVKKTYCFASSHCIIVLCKDIT